MLDGSSIILKRKIWNGLQFVRDNIERASNREGEVQVDSPYVLANSNSPFDADTWEFIKRGLIKTDPQLLIRLIMRKRKRSRLVCNTSFQSRSFGTEEKCESINLDSDVALQAAQTVFGTTILFGIRHRRPKKWQTYPLQRNDRINVITGTQKRGYIEFVFSTKSDTLTTRVKFESFAYDFDSAKRLIGCPSALFASMIGCSMATGTDAANNTPAGEESAANGVGAYPSCSISIGSYFQRGQSVFVIRRVDGEGAACITAECTSAGLNIRTTTKI